MQKPVSRAAFGRAVSIFVVVPVVSVLPFLAPVTATAQGTGEDDRLTILITASRFAETADETLVPVTVITREDIEEKQAQTLEDVLRTVPGLTLGNSGGVGKQTSVFLRGTESNHVLVLIDGVKVGSAISGLTPFEHLPLDQIEKIEVVRGPRSSLYGSEAIGGVIQIFTRKGTKETRPRFSAGAGSHGTRKGEFGVNGRTENGWYNFGASTYSTDGFDAYLPGPPDDDGHDNNSFSLRGGVALSDTVKMESSILRSESETETDGFSTNVSEAIVQTANVKATVQVGEQWQSSLLVGESKNESENFSNGVRGSMFDTTRDQISWQNNFRLNENNRIIAGVDYLEDKVNGTTNYAVDSRDNTGVFALWRTEINTHDFELALRNDDDEQFGNHSTGSIAWGRDLGGDKRLTASYATAFKAPTFDELYGPESEFAGVVYESNPDLDPETSASIDLGVSHRGSIGTWAVNFYRTEIDDLITPRTSTQMRGGESRMVRVPVNVEEVEIFGVEFTGTTHIGGWDISGVLTWQEAKESEGDNKGTDLLRRPRRKLDLDFSRRFGQNLFGVNLYAQSRSKDFDTDNAGFAIVNVRGELRLERNWSLGLKFNNLFDKEYETAADFPQDGRNVLMTLRYIH